MNPLLEYGSLAYVPDADYCAMFPEECPKWLQAVFVIARSHDCRYVMFDCDADALEELPTFDW